MPQKQLDGHRIHPSLDKDIKNPQALGFVTTSYGEGFTTVDDKVMC